MGGSPVLAVLSSVGLAMSSLAVPTSVPEATEIPCPQVEVDPPPDRPSQPTPPPHGPGERQIGGAALESDALVLPDGVPEPPAVSATTWLVADLDSGAVLGGCGPHEYAIPASTQKLLLAAALMPVLDPDEVVEVVAEDLDIVPNSSAVGLLLGGEYSIETLWLGLLLDSGNDAANTLARIGGGEEGSEGGLRLMNEEAQRLGAFQTHAATPSGLDGPGQFTSAYDLALIARPLFDREDFRQYVGTERADIPAQPHLGVNGYQIQNDNGLLFNYPGALGGKTGFTNLARHSFVGAAEREGRRLVVTLLGAEFQPLPTWQQAALLLDWGFDLPAGASVGRLVAPEELAQVAASSTQQPGGRPVGPPHEEPAPQSVVGSGKALLAAAALLAGVGLAGVAVFAMRRSRI